MLKKQVIPTIQRKWPRKRGIVFLQHDNASAHKSSYTADLLHKMQPDRLDIEIRVQLPYFPDFNILDLGFVDTL